MAQGAQSFRILRLIFNINCAVKWPLGKMINVFLWVSNECYTSVSCIVIKNWFGGVKAPTCVDVNTAVICIRMQISFIVQMSDLTVSSANRIN